MKVYIVTSGEYSDYRIDGVFSSEAEANKFIGKRGGNIEVYTIDKQNSLIERGYKTYSFYIRYDRTVEKVTTHDAPFDEDRSFITGPFHFDVPNSLDGSIMVHCLAKSEKQAVKVANEKLSQMIATGEWEDKRDWYFSQGRYKND